MTPSTPYAFLVDIGNTRIKWGIYDLTMGIWHKKGFILPHELSHWLQMHQPVLQTAALIKGSNVADAALRQQIDHACPSPIEWIHGETYRAGVQNAYRFPERLGADRWLSLIAARSAHEGNTLVVNVGTAVTIDVLDETGLFRGGLIVPGLHLMRESLAKGTAGLPLQAGQFTPYPTQTGEALYSGAIQSIAGAIMQMAHQMLADGIPPAQCMMSGGDAAQIAPHLSIPVTIVEHLVLDGLATLALAAFSATEE